MISASLQREARACAVAAVGLAPCSAIRSSAKLSAPIAKLMVQAMPPVILEASRPPIRGEKGAHGHADHVFDAII